MNIDEIYNEMLQDEFYIKRSIAFHEDYGEKKALREISDIISKMQNTKCIYKDDEDAYHKEIGRKRALKKMQNVISEMIDTIDRKFMEETAKYHVADNLVEKGYLYDDFYLYVPFTYKDDENPDPEIYLAISVWARYNWADGDIPVVYYWWCHREGNEFKTLDENFEDGFSYFVGRFPIDENYDFIKDLYHYGKKSGLNFDYESYQNFANRFKEDIHSSPSLDYLKNVDSRRGRSTSEELNLSLGLI